MKKWIALCIGLLSQQSWAALPPDSRNVIDLELMLKHIRSDYDMISTLRNIDMVNYTVTYGRHGETCVAMFGRKKSTLKPGMVGPMPDLEFKESHCLKD